jgi:hypothetical protein
VNALARTFEAAGFATTVINMMPVWGERFRTPRTLGVEFPFGHTCGPAGDAALQSRVVRAALDLLASDEGPPPVVRHFDEPWPGEFDDWKKAWQPNEASPIIRWMREQAAARAQQQREGGSA